MKTGPGYPRDRHLPPGGDTARTVIFIGDSQATDASLVATPQTAMPELSAILRTGKRGS